MANEQGREADRERTRKDGRDSDPPKLGGASKPGHISPQIDERDGTVRKGGQIAQSQQQATGEGGGQS